MSRRKQWSIRLISWAAAIVVLLTVPWRICAWGHGPWYRGDLRDLQRFSAGVERLVLGDGLSRDRFQTGSAQFDGEWLFGSYLMAGMGYCQFARMYPDLAAEKQPLARRCIELMLTPGVRAFDKETWSEDPIEGIDGPGHHAAYLGYFNLLLSLYRDTFDDSSFNELNDRISHKLARHLDQSEVGLLQSYPFEIYPVDNCFVIAGIALHQQASGDDHQAVIDRWARDVRARYIDTDTGLLFQAIDPRDGSPADEPRGSGTALGVFAVHYASARLGGAPLRKRDRMEFVSGGPLGNAILFAMFTTPREEP